MQGMLQCLVHTGSLFHCTFGRCSAEETFCGWCLVQFSKGERSEGFLAWQKSWPCCQPGHWWDSAAWPSQGWRSCSAASCSWTCGNVDYTESSPRSWRWMYSWGKKCISTLWGTGRRIFPSTTFPCCPKETTESGHSEEVFLSPRNVFPNA